MAYTRQQRLALFQSLREHAQAFVDCRDNLYEILDNFGIDGIMPTDTLNVLINKVASIELGITPVGSVTYDTNGTYDVTSKATVVINVPQNDTSTLPKLIAPTISRSGGTISVLNPSSNGSFNRNIKLYSNSQLVQSKAFSTQGAYTDFSIKTFPPGDYVITAKCSNSANFQDSNDSGTSVTCSCYSINNNITQGATNNSDTTIADGESYTEIVTPNGGWWLPEFITITQDGVTLEEGTDYTWDMYTGSVGLVANGDLVLTITNEETPKLKTPNILDFNRDTKIITVDYVKYAQRYSFLIDGVTVMTKTVEDVLLTTLSLPNVVDSMASGVVGTKIYLFGGSISSNAIRVFDTENNTITTLSTTLPSAATGMASGVVGTKIYLFGGNNDVGSNLSAIRVFNTEDNTITTLSTTLSKAVQLMASGVVGTKIYLFGGTPSSNAIQVFDTENNTITTLSTTLPSNSYSMASGVVGTKIYLFGGYIGSYSRAIRVFDTENETITTLSTTLLNDASTGIASSVVGTKIYLFGGFTGATYGYLDTIQVFDTENNTITTLSKPLPQKLSNRASGNVGNKFYLFGGIYNNTGTLTRVNTINVYYPDGDDTILANKLKNPVISVSNLILTINESTACYGLTVDLYIDSVYKENIVIGDNV